MTDTWHCAACSTANPPNLSRCMTCDNVISAIGTPPASENPGLQGGTSEQRWVCRDCQRSNPAETGTCASCGAARHAPPPTPVARPSATAEAPAKSTATYLAVVLGLIVVGLVAGVLAFTAFSAGDETSDARPGEELRIEGSSTRERDTGDEHEGPEGDGSSRPGDAAPMVTAVDQSQPGPQDTAVTAPPAPVTSPPVTASPDPSSSPSPSHPSPGLSVPGTTPSGGMGSATANGSGLALMPTGSWVTVLESVPHSEGLAEAEHRAAGFSTGMVHLVDTADHPGMTPGYYAVVVGPYGSEDAARDGCSLVGRDLGGTCYARRTS